MTLVGSNLKVVAKELELEIERLADYVLTKTQVVALYNTETPSAFLNIPGEYLQRFNAWLQLPGEYWGYWKECTNVLIKGDMIKAPRLVLMKEQKEATDLFSFITKAYKQKNRVFDLAYTMSRLNEQSFSAFVDRYAQHW